MHNQIIYIFISIHSTKLIVSYYVSIWNISVIKSAKHESSILDRIDLSRQSTKFSMHKPLVFLCFWTLNIQNKRNHLFKFLPIYHKFCSRIFRGFNICITHKLLHVVFICIVTWSIRVTNLYCLCHFSGTKIILNRLYQIIQFYFWGELGRLKILYVTIQKNYIWFGWG